MTSGVSAGRTSVIFTGLQLVSTIAGRCHKAVGLSCVSLSLVTCLSNLSASQSPSLPNPTPPPPLPPLTGYYRGDWYELLMGWRPTFENNHEGGRRVSSGLFHLGHRQVYGPPSGVRVTASRVSPRAPGGAQVDRAIMSRKPCFIAHRSKFTACVPTSLRYQTESRNNPRLGLNKCSYVLQLQQISTQYTQKQTAMFRLNHS